jgi:hypothetical protein
MVTWSGRTSGPTVGPTGPQVTCGPRAPLGPTHEERRTMRRAVHGGRGREKQGSMAVTHWSGQRDDDGGGQDARRRAFYCRTCMKQNGPMWGC